MANNDNSEDLPKSSPINDWDMGWDEFWDQESEVTDPLLSNQNLENALNFTKKITPSRKDSRNELEAALEMEIENDFSPQLNWGVIDDTKPTNLNTRLKSFITAPFSTVLEPKKAKESMLEVELPHQIKDQLESESENEDHVKNEDKNENKVKPKIQIRAPKIHSTIGEANHRSARIVIESSDLAFNNLNNVSRNELNEINSLLEGSLGKKDSVKFDKDIVQDKNVNFVAQEKILQKEKAISKKIKVDLDKDLLLSSEETIVSDSHPSDTLVPGLNDIRFDLKKAQETSHLFDPGEIDEILIRLPEEKARYQRENNIVVDKTQEKIEIEKIGQALFEGNQTIASEPKDSPDSLLDSLLDEIDGEAGNDTGPADFHESNEASLDKDEIITEQNIVDDNSDAALEFMDTAASEAESLFEDFFKQGTAEKEKTTEVKVTYLDVLKNIWKEIKVYSKLCLRFIKEPKYFLEYFQITLKDIFVAVGAISILITFSGIINLQYLTEKFPMNLF